MMNEINLVEFKAYQKERYSEDVLQKLTPREEKIIRHHHGLDIKRHSISALANYFEVSTERILQIIVRAERKVNFYNSQKNSQK